MSVTIAVVVTQTVQVPKRSIKPYATFLVVTSSVAGVRAAESTYPIVTINPNGPYHTLT